MLPRPACLRNLLFTSMFRVPITEIMSSKREIPCPAVQYSIGQLLGLDAADGIRIESGSIKTSPASRNYHDRKRSEGERHSQAILCLARRRPKRPVAYKAQRDNTSYQPELPRAA
jgi:hypothetical protein